MATINFFLSRSKAKETSIYLRLKNGRSLDLTRKTGLIINRQEWSTTKGLPKQNTATNKKTSSKLLGLKNEILNNFNDAFTTGVNINAEWLQTKIDIHFNRISHSGKSELLVDAIQDIINNAETRKNSKNGIGISESRIKTYKQLKSNIERFSKKTKYKVRDIDVAFSKKFLNWLVVDQKYSKGYSLKQISDLKVVCNDAQLNGVEVNSQLSNIVGGQVKNCLLYTSPSPRDRG